MNEGQDLSRAGHCCNPEGEMKDGGEGTTLFGAGAGGSSNPPRVPNHTLISIIGKGSYGEVWQARNELGQMRAVKIVYRRQFATAKPYEREFAGIKRFEPISREHEGFVDILQVGIQEADGFFFYVMELADCADSSRPQSNYQPTTLLSEIQRLGGLQLERVLKLGISLAEALEFLHVRKLVHRDVKPSNIIFVNGRPKLADAGLVTELGYPRSFVGTDGYIPPEGPGTPEADLYSLGKVLYEAATGNDRLEFPKIGSALDDPDVTTMGFRSALEKSSPQTLDGGLERLLEFNEVLLKACENDFRKRYRNARAFLDDLKAVESGKSLRQARLRRLKARTFAGVAIIALSLIGIFGGVTWIKRTIESRPRLLLREDFDGEFPNANLWASSFLEFPGTDIGSGSMAIEQSGGELTLQTSAGHTNGQSVSKTAWIDLKPDLRSWAPCRIEFDLSSSTTGGISAVVMTTGISPASNQDIGGISLGNLDADPILGTKPTGTSYSIFLSARHQAAFVTSLSGRGTEFDVIDLRQLPEWRLRFFCSAAASSGYHNGNASVSIRRLSVVSGVDDIRIAGRVIEETAEWPVGGAVIENEIGKPLAKTAANGVFLIRDARERLLTVRRRGYGTASLRIRSRGETGGLAEVRLPKLEKAVGDVVETYPIGNRDVLCIGFHHNQLWQFQRLRSGFGWLSSVAGSGKSAPIEIPAELQSFADAGWRWIGFEHWRNVGTNNIGVAFDLDGDFNAPVIELRDRQSISINWPRGCAFDGTSFWFVEHDRINRRWGLRSLNLEKREVDRFLPTADTGISGLAWDGSRFWIASSIKHLYAIDPASAIGGGTVEAGAIKDVFPGQYESLTYGNGFLFGLDKSKKRICKIKIFD